jgi:DNA-binding CsgD family transcriptional regulator
MMSGTEITTTVSLETDKAAILAVLNGETEAWMRRDFDALASYWLHSPQARRMLYFSSFGTYVDEGWDTISEHFRQAIAQTPESYDPKTRLRRERMNTVIIGDMAWVSYDQIGVNTGDDFELAGLQHELKIFQRIDGAWKISCIVVMQRAIDHETCPLIEIGPDSEVLWMNDEARQRIDAHRGLVVTGQKLRARHRILQAELKAAVAWGFLCLERQNPPHAPQRPSRAVILGEKEDGALVICWVIVADRKVLVSFDDEKMLERRIQSARQIYRLSETQALLAQHIVRGHDLPTAAVQLGVSVNTVRTHLQRMFERTGVRSQSALVGVLLSADVPSAA